MQRGVGGVYFLVLYQSFIPTLAPVVPIGLFFMVGISCCLHVRADLITCFTLCNYTSIGASVGIISGNMSSQIAPMKSHHCGCFSCLHHWIHFADMFGSRQLLRTCNLSCPGIDEGASTTPSPHHHPPHSPHPPLHDQ
jgi:hypothetical protein